MPPDTVIAPPYPFTVPTIELTTAEHILIPPVTVKLLVLIPSPAVMLDRVIAPFWREIPEIMLCWVPRTNTADADN